MVYQCSTKLSPKRLRASANHTPAPPTQCTPPPNRLLYALHSIPYPLYYRVTWNVRPHRVSSKKCIASYNRNFNLSPVDVLSTCSPGVLNDQYTNSGRPRIFCCGTNPQNRPSRLFARLSPIANTIPGGTTRSSLWICFGNSSTQSITRLSIASDSTHSRFWHSPRCSRSPLPYRFNPTKSEGKSSR